MFKLLNNFFFSFTPGWVCGLRAPWELRTHLMYSWHLSSAVLLSGFTLGTHLCWVKQNVVSEDDLEIHFKSTPLIHTKTWKWMCPRGVWQKGSWYDFPKAESWSLLHSIPFQHPPLKSPFRPVLCLQPQHARALSSPLLQGAMHFLVTVDTPCLPLTCLRLAQSGVLPPAIHFTNAWNDWDTKLILCHWNSALGGKKEKNWVLLLNPQLFKD